MRIHMDKDCFLIYKYFGFAHSPYGDATAWMKWFTRSENKWDVFIHIVRDKNQHVDFKMDMIMYRWLLNISFNLE